MISENPSLEPDLTSRLKCGALCAQDKDGHWIYSNPGDAMFSSVVMVATHYWEDNSWKPIRKVNDETVA